MTSASSVIRASRFSERLSICVAHAGTSLTKPQVSKVQESIPRSNRCAEGNRSSNLPGGQKRRSGSLTRRFENRHALHVRRHRKDVGLDRSRKSPGQSLFFDSWPLTRSLGASNERHAGKDCITAALAARSTPRYGPDSNRGIPHPVALSLTTVRHLIKSVDRHRAHPHGIPLWAPPDAESFVSDAPAEQPVMVATQAAPPSSREWFTTSGADGQVGGTAPLPLRNGAAPVFGSLVEASEDQSFPSTRQNSILLSRFQRATKGRHPGQQGHPTYIRLNRHAATAPAASKEYRRRC